MGANATSAPAVVLIAEGDDMIAELLSSVVEHSGAVPLVASDGQQALRLARAKCPALLITEMLMPQLDGAALIAAVRSECGTQLPTILLASLLNAQTKAAGATAVLPRPFHIAILEAQIAQLLAT